MSLTPEDIENQVFKERFRGYDQDEVDRFLDRVSARIGELTHQSEEMRERIRELERRTREATESETLLQRTMIAAQRSADETVDEARATAEQTLADAREQADKTLTDARLEADETLEDALQQAGQALEDARQQAEQILEDAREQAEELVAESRRRVGEDERRALDVLDQARRAVVDLSAFRSEYRERVEAVISEQLAMLDRMGELPELPEGLRSLAGSERGAGGRADDDAGQARRVPGRPASEN